MKNKSNNRHIELSFLTKKYVSDTNSLPIPFIKYYSM